MTHPLKMRPGLNGDSREELAAQAYALAGALSNASMRLRLAKPHGRNYQHIGASWVSFGDDLGQWNAAVAGLKAAQDYADAMALAVAEGEA